MSRLRRYKISVEPEKKICTAAIISTTFLQKFKKIYRPEYIKLNYVKVILQWIFDYFETYEKAPSREIQTIYEIEKENLQEEDQKIIGDFLQLLSDEYDETLNSEYYVNIASDYFSSRSLSILYEEGFNLIKKGKIEQAEELLSKRKKIEIEESDVYEPLSEVNIRNFDVNDTENRLFTFMNPALSELIGWFCRDWLVAVTAPEKRGKSFTLDEIAIAALMRNLKVIKFGLEMNKQQNDARLYKRITGLHDDTTDLQKIIRIPIFDCKRNQEDSCEFKERQSKVGIEDDEGNRKSFKNKGKYSPCTYCRFNRREEYEVAHWFQEEEIGVITNDLISKKVNTFKKIYRIKPSNFKVKIFPAFSANSEDVRKILDDLEYNENWIPDVIIEDYLDIEARERFTTTDIENIDKKWQSAKNIASTRHLCYITADQTNAAARGQRSLTQDNWSRSKTKDSHLDLRIGINQTIEEKKDGIMRLNVLFHRHKFFAENREVMCLQALELARGILDAEWINK